MSYQAPVKDMLFNIQHLAGLETLTEQIPAFADFGLDTAGAVLAPGEEVVVFDKDGLKITAFAVDHHPILPAYGYRFDYKGRSVVFTGDTVKSENIARFTKASPEMVINAARRTGDRSSRNLHHYRAR